MTMRNRIAALERFATYRRYDGIEIPKRSEPPTRVELERLRRELSIPDDVFDDLFGEQLKDLP